MFEHVRKDSVGGGLLTAVHKTLDPVSVGEEDDVEIIVVEGVLNKKKVRFINGYGPQENSKKEKKEMFFSNS